MDPALESGAINKNGTPTLRALRPPRRDTSGVNWAEAERLNRKRGKTRININLRNMVLKNLKCKSSLKKRERYNLKSSMQRKLL